MEGSLGQFVPHLMLQAMELAEVYRMIESQLFGSLLSVHGVRAVCALVVAKVSMDHKIHA